MKISVFGSGYVGLVSGVCFAEMGNDVHLVDVDVDKVELLKQGKSPIYEPGLDQLLQDNLAAGRLHFHLEPKRHFKIVKQHLLLLALRCLIMVRS